MTRTLLFKELRSLAPFIVLVLFLVAIEVVYLFGTEFPDQWDLATSFYESDPASVLFLYFILAFSLAQGLLQRERAEDTLEFLDSLPVSRHRVFWCKVATGYAVLFSMSLLLGLFYLLIQFWSADSTQSRLYLGYWLPGQVLDAWMLWIYFCIGLALSFWGRFGLIVIALWTLMVTNLKQWQWPGAELLDPLAAAQLYLEGERLVLPWRILLPQMGAALVLLAAAYRGFLRLGLPATPARRALTRATYPLFYLGLAGTLMAWFVYMIVSAFQAEEEEIETVSEAPAPAYLDWSVSRAKTDSFSFVYPSERARAAEGLIAQAETLHDEVTGFLNAERQRNLVIDLTSRSPRHAGTAYWKKVRINLDAGDSPEELAAIFGHELAHVYIDQISDGRVRDQFDSTRFFHEGLASWLEFHRFREPDVLPEIRRVAAVARARDQVRFEELVSSSTLSAKYAAEWVYPLGEIFLQAIIDTYGEDAPEKLTRAFAREGARNDLSSLVLWQDTFQACGFHLEEATAAFFALLDEEVSLHRDWIDAQPRLRGTVVADGDRVGLRIEARDGRELDRKRIACRLRSDADTAEYEYLVRRLDRDGVAWVARNRFPSGTLDYQLIYRPEEELMMPLFDPWVTVALPSE